MIGKWLQDWSMRDLDKWARENPTFDPAKDTCSDTEYLFYINVKLRHVNTILLRIERLLGIILVIVGLMFAKQMGLF